VGNVSLGYLAQIKPSLARELNVEEGLFVFELDTAPLMDWGQALFPEPARYPAAYRDVSFLASAYVPAIEIAREVRHLGGERVASVRLFDVYAGQGIPEGQRSLAFSVAWRHPDRTLGEGEVDSLHNALREALAARGYVLR
jgi:phenylalanyl-tRNA synthetase beta chain